MKYWRCPKGDAVQSHPFLIYVSAACIPTRNRILTEGSRKLEMCEK